MLIAYKTLVRGKAIIEVAQGERVTASQGKRATWGILESEDGYELIHIPTYLPLDITFLSLRAARIAGHFLSQIEELDTMYIPSDWRYYRELAAELIFGNLRREDFV